MKTLPFLFFAAPLFVSCQIQGLTSDYSYLSAEGKKRIVKYTGAIDSISDYSKVYDVTAEQVKDFISNHDEVLIYNYTPYCRYKYCISPKELISTCKKQKVEVLIISNIYDDILVALNDEFPILMINTEVYGTKWRSKYIDLFYKDLKNHILGIERQLSTRMSTIVNEFVGNC
ncbi:MAG: hypothetical protein ACOYJG_02690 [Prevotella sp.]|jgi:hypothetical protein